jgi:GTP cyclohydrolase III
LLNKLSIYSKVTDEATLKAKMKEVRDGFKADIKVARGVVVSAHEAVKNVAVALAQIKGIEMKLNN